MKKYLFSIFLIITAYIFQVSVFPYLEIGGIRPNLLIMITCILGFTLGSKIGLITGFMSGMLVDIMAGSVVGFSALFYMYAGYVNGFFTKDYVKEELFLPLFFVIVSDLCYEVFYYIFYFLFKNNLNFGYFFKRIIIPEMLYTAFITLIMYIFIYYIAKRVEYKKRRSAVLNV